MKNKDMPAIKFYKNIEDRQDSFKLINGLFIVKYISDDICYFVAHFHKARSVLNNTKTNRLEFFNNDFLQLFDRKRNLTMTSLKVWLPLNISWHEQPIGKILK